MGFFILEESALPGNISVLPPISLLSAIWIWKPRQLRKDCGKLLTENLPDVQSSTMYVSFRRNVGIKAS